MRIYVNLWKPSQETRSSSVTQEIPRILWIPKVHYHVQNSPTPDRILIQIDPVHSPIQQLEDPF